MLLLTSAWFFVALFSQCFSLEESCSKFDFEEKLLQKMVKMEVDFNQLQKNINEVQTSMDSDLKTAEKKLEALDTKTEIALDDLHAKFKALDEQLNNTVEITQKPTDFPPSAVCPDGWTYFQDSCYYVSQTSAQFYDAEKYCVTLDAHLVNIETPNENTFLRHQLKQLKAPQHWIGMTDVVQEGTWKHYPSGAMVTYFDWGKNQPNNGRFSNCVAFWESFGHLWVDEPCTRNFRPICEKKARA